MGLAAPKNRSKLSRDPNNSTWTSSTTRFGHRVLTAQGWTPGSTLGATDASHAAHYTAGSSSHVRVVLRDGNQGIGVKRGPGANDETFGLTLLSGLLGRLNGKSEEVLRKEESAVRDIKLLRYQGERWGSVGFVFGGYLVGDKIEKSMEGVETAGGENVKNGLKRKRQAAAVESVEIDQAKPTKRSKKSQKSKSQTSREEESKGIDASQVVDGSQMDSSEDPSDVKRKRKEEKRARKEARRLKKEQKQLKKAQKQAAASNCDTDLVQGANDIETTPVATPDQNQGGTSTPMFAGGRGRHAIRQKYIQQKQMACMNDKALNEIFMIKSKA